MSESEPLQEQEIYPTIGDAGFERICREFYRQVVGDDILAPMYPSDDMPGAEERLKDFLIYRFGGPQKYIQERGHPRLRGRHMPFAIDTPARDRWMQLMDQAINKADIPPPAAATLRQFFGTMATFLINRPG